MLTEPFRLRTLALPLYALLVLPLALVGFVLVLAGMLLGAVLSITPLGPWLISGALRLATALGALHRSLAAGLLRDRVPAPLTRTEPGVFGWRRALLRDPANWRAAGWLALAPLSALPGLLATVLCYVYGTLGLSYPVTRHWNHSTVPDPDGGTRQVGLDVPGTEPDSLPLQLVVPALGLLLLLAAPWLLRKALLPHRVLLRHSLGRTAEQERIRTLEETRTRAVDDAVSTLRRIERDLHDGTQARLVGLGMQLTVIRELLSSEADRQQLLTVVDTAQQHAREAVTDLRALVRGIHPPALEQGLDTALATLAAGTVLPVELDVDLPERPAPATESIAYFCAAELLANAVKHSGAPGVTIDVRQRAAGRLRLTVTDEGAGGAHAGGGSGLTGLRDRVRTVDGTLEVSSPAGGPTVITVELPG
ncbi:histidine kinase [Streptomyces oceani]|uniref:histidine kinase n=1 Tax=Streptomyces oceani TaxID=1075402 RepID=A0A1E7KNS1_9ACTN|nr:histidine kinase [Streptomyces oceani]